MSFAATRAIVASMIAAAVTSTPALAGQTVSFTSGALQGTTGLNDPTSLQFGPDGRLYVAERYGLLRVYTIARNGPGDYAATAAETIGLIQTIQNHNDDGTLNADTRRQTTGLLVTGSAANPVMYVTSSDWRVSVGADSGLDTNSGVLSRLTWNGAAWTKLDMVRGLPRNEENHATNGMALDVATNTLYIAQGGHTNMGAPSNNFSFQPEYAYSAALLSVDLDQIGDGTFDMPTLDDPDRPGVTDANDPFGGNNGLNQAVMDPAGPVQVHAPGFRNPYDVVMTQSGRLYTIDNGPNQGWGGPPIGCSLMTNEADSHSYGDGLHFVTGPGYYGGHPSPTRANAANLFAGQSPIVAPNPIECNYLVPGVDDDALHVWGSSTNGITEYTAGNFGGAMQGNLLAASYSGTIQRIQLNAAGDTATSVSTIFSGFGAQPLDVVAQGDADVFPGSVWVAVFGGDAIVVNEPVDFIACSGLDDTRLDDDLDGFSNADEIDNGTDPCSAASVPDDNDGDFISDLNDPDDDDDGTPDLTDAFATDPFDGAATAMPISYGWAVGEPGFGFFGLGFTGLMTNGSTDYLDQFDPLNLTPGGAAGKFTIDAIGPGDAYAGLNDQTDAFQFGVNVTSASGPFAVRTRLDSPFFDGFLPAGEQSQGLSIGDGTQDDYIKLVVGAIGKGGFRVLEERAGTVVRTDDYAVGNLLAATFIDVELIVDPLAGTVHPHYAVDGGVAQPLGAPVPLAGSVLARLQGPDALAVGVIATSRGSVPFTATWDSIDVVPLGSTAEALITVDPPGGSIDGSTYGNGSFAITNTSAAGQQITSVTFDLTTSVLPDLVFDPDGTAGDVVAKPFTLNSAGGTGSIGHSFLDSFHNGVDPDDGYDALEVTYTDFDPGETMTFSIDNDPTTIKGTTAPGPNEAGSVSGLELIGAEVTVAFDDGTTHVASLFRTGATLDASEAVAAAAPPPAPSITVSGLGATNAQVASAGQVVRVVGPIGADVELLVVEGGLFVNGTPNPMTGPFPNGYDVDPWEANSAITVTTYPTTIGMMGYADVPITLTRFAGDGGYTLGNLDATGRNTLVAVVRAGDGRTGPPSNAIVLELVDADVTAAPAGVAFGSTVVSTASTLPLTLTSAAAIDVQVTGLQLTGDVAFSLVTPPALPATITAGGTLDLTVQFAPAAVDTFSGLLTITHSGNGSPLAVPLTGAGVSDGGAEGVVLYRVNCGGPQVAAADGTTPLWANDAAGAPSPLHNAGSSTFESSNPITIDPAVPASVPPTVFQSERWDDTAAPEMQWSFPVTAGVPLEVRLYFAEVWSGAFGPNLRVFDVMIEGNPALTSFDPFVEAGGENIGIVRTFQITPDATLDVEFIHGIQNPAVKGIEIVVVNAPPQANDDVASVVRGRSVDIDVTINDVDPDGAVDPTTVTIVSDPTYGSILVDPVSGVVTYQHDPATITTDSFAYVVQDDGGVASDLTTVTVLVHAASAAVPIYRVNCGGPAIPAADSSAPTWSGDTPGAPSPYEVGGPTDVLVAPTAPITLDTTVTPAAPAEVFRSARWDPAAGGEMQWRFPAVPGAPYEVKLFFAEIAGLSGSGERVFSVDIEGETVLVDLDAYDAAGANAGFMRRFSVIPSGTFVAIDFARSVLDPSINAIEIARVPVSSPDGLDRSPVFPPPKVARLGPVNRYPFAPGQQSAEGETTGSADRGGRPHAFRRSADGGTVDLGTLGGATSTGNAIGGDGTIVGASDTADGARRAFVVVRRTMRDLGTLGGRTSAAFDVNDAGVVVGTSETVHGAPHAFVWTASDGMIDLNDLLPPGSRWTLETAMEIDDAGVVRGVGLHRERTSVFEVRVDLGVRRHATDLTGDGRVDGADVARLLGRWGACDDCPADLDRDGAVGFDDLTTLLRGVRDR